MFNRIVGTVSIWIFVKMVMPIVVLCVDYLRLKRKERKEIDNK